jgi:hypothetical protein
VEKAFSIDLTIPVENEYLNFNLIVGYGTPSNPILGIVSHNV